MKVEVIVQNEKDAIAAEQSGADRLELVSAISEGGLTPSYGTIVRVLASVRIPVQVMIRPHSYGFVYDESDFLTIKEDILMTKMLGANGIVFGCLCKNGNIDEPLLEAVLDLADGMDITFHRAFDAVKNQQEAFKVICKYGDKIKRILTSGGKNNAANATAELHHLVKLSQTHNCSLIMPGAGLTPDNIKSVAIETEAKEFHFGSGVRKHQSFAHPIDKQKLKYLKNELNSII